VGVCWQERHAARIGAGRGQFDSGHRAQELVGNLNQHARAVTRVGFGAGRTAVFHVAQRTDTTRDDVVARDTFHVRHERHAACVVFEARVVETRRRAIKGGIGLRRHITPLADC